MKTVLYILSTNYAGSHFLSLLVGSHSRAVHAGELQRFGRVPVRKKPCYMCGDFRTCPMLHGIEPGRIDTLYPTLFANLGPDIDVVVDNSKQTAWAARFLGDRSFQRSYVHLIRDPRALARRWDRDHEKRGRLWQQRWKLFRHRPTDVWEHWRATPRQLALHMWVRQNQVITNFLHRHRLDYHLMTYRDLATDTAAALRALMPHVGLEYEPHQLAYWNFEHHGTQKPQYDWIKVEKQTYFDIRWKEYLAPPEQEAIIRHPLVARYLDRLGVQVTDDGLTMSRNRSGLGSPPTG